VVRSVRSIVAEKAGRALAGRERHDKRKVVATVTPFGVCSGELLVEQARQRLARIGPLWW